MMRSNRDAELDTYSAEIVFRRPRADEDCRVVMTGTAESAREVFNDAYELVPSNGQPIEVGSWRGGEHERPADAMMPYEMWVEEQFERVACD